MLENKKNYPITLISMIICMYCIAIYAYIFMLFPTPILIYNNIFVKFNISRTVDIIFNLYFTFFISYSIYFIYKEKRIFKLFFITNSIINIMLFGYILLYTIYTLKKFSQDIEIKVIFNSTMYVVIVIWLIYLIFTNIYLLFSKKVPKIFIN